MVFAGGVVLFHVWCFGNFVLVDRIFYPWLCAVFAGAFYVLFVQIGLFFEVYGRVICCTIVLRVYVGPRAVCGVRGGVIIRTLWRLKGGCFL